MSAEPDRYEEARLRLQRWQIFATFLAPFVAIFGVWFSVRGTLEAQANAAEAQARAQEAQAIAQSGEGFCFNPFAPEFEVEVRRFCEKLEQAPSLPVQRELIQQLVEHPGQQKQIFAMWRAIYVVQSWIGRIEEALTSEAPKAGG